MGSVFAHIASSLVYFLFPNNLDFIALLAACVLPDLDYFFIIGKDVIKRSKKEVLALNAFKTGFFHSLIGIYMILLPLLLMSLYYLYPFFNLEFVLSKIILSAIVGFSMHILLDLPSHSYLMLFYPKIIKNPFLLNLNLKIVKKLYPYKYMEEEPFTYLREYHWIIISTLLAIIVFMVFIL
ncbi:MAG: metal-dependent hydrolase [Nanoarchaeota archaeon]